MLGTPLKGAEQGTVTHRTAGGWGGVGLSWAVALVAETQIQAQTAGEDPLLLEGGCLVISYPSHPWGHQPRSEAVWVENQMGR